MTAIVLIYTHEGFVLGSDGRVRLVVDPPRIISEDAQKIFPINDGDKRLAYALAGIGGNDEAGFSVVEECRRQVAALALLKQLSCYEYVDTFTRNLKNVLSGLRREGRIDEFQEHRDAPASERRVVSRIFMAGYYRGEACWKNGVIRFRSPVELVHEIESQVIQAGQNMAMGSQTIPRMAVDGDLRFARYGPRLRQTGPPSRMPSSTSRRTLNAVQTPRPLLLIRCAEVLEDVPR
jgi:hypothetical protein